MQGLRGPKVGCQCDIDSLSSFNIYIHMRWKKPTEMCANGIPLTITRLLRYRECS